MRIREHVNRESNLDYSKMELKEIITYNTIIENLIKEISQIYKGNNHNPNYNVNYFCFLQNPTLYDAELKEKQIVQVQPQPEKTSELNSNLNSLYSSKDEISFSDFFREVLSKYSKDFADNIRKSIEFNKEFFLVNINKTPFFKSYISSK